MIVKSGAKSPSYVSWSLPELSQIPSVSNALQPRGYIATNKKGNKSGAGSNQTATLVAVFVVIGVGIFAAIAATLARSKKNSTSQTTSTTSGRPRTNQSSSSNWTSIGRRPEGCSATSGDRDPPEIPPSYGEHGSTPLVSRGTDAATYDPPSAFDLVSRVVSEQFHISGPVHTSVGVVSGVPNPEDLTLLERMTHVQRMVNELNNLLSKEPAGGYKQHSVEEMKVLQLRQSIAMMCDAPTPSITTHRFAITDIEAGSPAPDSSITSSQDRALEVQRLFTEIERLQEMASDNPLERSVMVQSIRERIIQLMEQPDEPVVVPAAASTSSPGAITFPKPVYFPRGGVRASLEESLMPGASAARTGPATKTDFVNGGTRHGNEDGEGETSGGGRETTEIIVPKELPPPYRAYTKDTSDDVAMAGASTVK